MHADLFFDFSESVFEDGLTTLGVLKVVPMAQFRFAWLSATQVLVLLVLLLG